MKYKSKKYHLRQKSYANKCDKSFLKQLNKEIERNSKKRGG